MPTTMTPSFNVRKTHEKHSPPPTTMTPKAVSTPIPALRTAAWKKSASSSEKETPTVLFASSLSTAQSPYAANTTTTATAAAKNDSVFKNNNYGAVPPLNTQSSRKKARVALSAVNDNVDSSSSDGESTSTHILEYESACSVIQIVLECGIASVCRLRKIFPVSFFTKMEVEGTTVTRFNEEYLKSLCYSSTSAPSSDDDDGDDEDEEKGHGEVDIDDLGPISPLTYDATQKDLAETKKKKLRRVDGNERALAFEARLLLRWLKGEGAGEILKKGKLARVIFGVCIPSNKSVKENNRKSKSNNDELFESYSFQIACNKPLFQRKIQQTQVKQSCTSLFRNLNGYSAGTSLSQVVPLGTQSSVASHLSSLDLSQKSLMMSMSQSIRAKVKKNRGNSIPKSRYLTLRVDFNQSLTSSELPSALKSASISGFANKTNQLVPSMEQHLRRHANATARSSVFDDNSMKENFVVTPLGKVAEDSFSGLCVEMIAFSKEQRDDYGSDDEQSLRSITSLRGRHEFETDELDVDSGDAPKPFTQADNNNATQSTDNLGSQRSTMQESNRALAQKNADQEEHTLPNDEEDVDDSKNLQPGAKCFGLPYGLGGKTAYFKCIVLNRHTARSYTGKSDRVQYDVEFQENAVKRRRQSILHSRIVSSHRMRFLINSAISRHYNHYEEVGELVAAVANDIGVSPELVGFVLSKRLSSHE